MTIRPGDYIIGDLNGVVCIPLELVPQTLTLLEPLAKADHSISQDLRAGVKFAEASRTHRATLPSGSSCCRRSSDLH